MKQEQISQIVDAAEMKGRNNFSTVCQQEKWCRVNRFATKRGSKWDVSFMSGTTQVIGEVKQRRYDSDTFNDWYFQADKWEALNKLAKANTVKTGKETKIAYINAYNNNIMNIWLFDIDQLNETPTLYREMQTNDWSNQSQMKSVYGLHRVNAHKFEINKQDSIFTK